MEITKPKLLLVEGKDEVQFFRHYCSHLNINDICCIDIGGKQKFKPEFKVIINAPGFSELVSFAIIQDADVSQQSTIQSIQHLLTACKFPAPTGHAQFDTSSHVKIGIYVMPGNRESGMLENLMLDTVNGHPVRMKSDHYISSVNQIKEQDDQFNPPKNEHKARLLAYLSGMEDSVSSLGLGAAKGYFNFESEVLDELKQFLLEM